MTKYLLMPMEKVIMHIRLVFKELCQKVIMMTL